MKRRTAAAYAVWTIAVSSCVLGCGGSDAHARLARLVDRGAYGEAVAATRAKGREPQLEKALAEVLLEQAAKSADSERRRRAFSELALAGTRSRPVLSRLVAADRPLTRALAARAAMQLGDDGARDQLRELANSPEPELSALGFQALDPVTNRQQLVAALTEPNAERRAAAVSVLSSAAPAVELRAALEGVVRYDPDASVRAGALVALSKHGSAARAAIERALDDEAEVVRLSALSALGALAQQGCASNTESAEEAACDPAGIYARLARDLGGVPTPETLTAAAVLLRAANAPEPERAREVFSRALVAGDARLRGRAAVLCRTLAAHGCASAVLCERLTAERTPEVKLLVALAAGPSDPLAQSVLRLLARDTKGSIAVEAAAELAVSGDAEAGRTLARALQHQDPRVRVSALRALARVTRDGAENAEIETRIADRLADRDEHVRVAAAAAVLAAG